MSDSTNSKSVDFHVNSTGGYVEPPEYEDTIDHIGSISRHTSLGVPGVTTSVTTSINLETNEITTSQSIDVDFKRVEVSFEKDSAGIDVVPGAVDIGLTTTGDVTIGVSGELQDGTTAGVHTSFDVPGIGRNISLLGEYTGKVVATYLGALDSFLNGALKQGVSPFKAESYFQANTGAEGQAARAAEKNSFSSDVSAAESAVESLVEGATNAGQAIVDGFTSGGNKIANGNIIGGIADIGRGIGEAVVEVAKGIGNAIADVGRGISNAISSVFGQRDDNDNKGSDRGKPIILDMDGDGIEVLVEGVIDFDMDDDGFLERTSWVDKDDAFLVLDLNADGTRGQGDGVIDQTKELVLAKWLGWDGATDLQALALFDQSADMGGNNDGLLTSADSVWSELRVWQDSNSNGVSDSGELRSLNELGFESINLTYDDGSDFADLSNDITVYNNKILGTASYTRNGVVQEGGVGDVALSYLAEGYQKSTSGVEQTIAYEVGSSRKLYDIQSSSSAAVDLAGGDFDGAIGDGRENRIDASGSTIGVELYGHGGNDHITGSSFDDEIVGGSYNDTINGGDGWDILVGSEGHDVIRGGRNGDTIYGDGGHDRLSGEDGWDTIHGGRGDDWIWGSTGQDTIRGGAGFDRLNGGANADVFEFFWIDPDTGYGDGYDIVQDFNISLDTVRFMNSIGNTMQNLSFSQEGNDLRVAYGDDDDVILFRNLSETQFTASNIEFV
ncbi:calcium-binding protein [Litoreibacter roseus]|uniref:Hemolysin-type calcium-binding repeat-containing protein n=1 Tax=Litoreibacter roseus TaxID=2601869 RepID=A0A6N6JH54_9RHOB|nr:calcium-binding protein [Litoreibacter roseus]GFE65556.1 hypothetical protein KIN_26300 [Litoreibacter roseus]